MADVRRNIELKCRCADLDAARLIVTALGAEPAGLEQQVDTYFTVAHGRLKLRTINGRDALLIWYERPDSTATRGCNYYLVPTADPELLTQALTAANGLRGTVRKHREVLLWHNVRIHLDRVDGLGRFIEFEAVLSSAEDETTGHQRLAQLVDALGLTAEDRLATSYAELLGL